MKLEDMKNLLIPENSSLEEAMLAIDKHGLGLVFLGEEVPTALITDGDVRRALLGGSAISTLASEVGNYHFAFARSKDHPSKIAELLSKYRHVPILDSRNKLIEIATKGSSGVIPVYEPRLGLQEWKNLQECIETGWISSGGNFVKQFEKMIAEFLGTPEKVLTVSNGTVALELCLRTLGIGQGDEVIVPDLTFVATANAVANVGAIPVPVDVDFRSGLMDIESAVGAVSSRTRAIIPVHLYGRPLDIEALRESLANNQILVIEDCAEAFGTFLNGRHVGTLGDAAAFSFFGNKNITTGEGGAVLFRNELNSELAFAKRGHGFSASSRRVSLTQGSNMRMTNLQAAIGVAQIGRIREILKLKDDVSKTYTEILEKEVELILPEWNSNEEGVDWLYTVGVPSLNDVQMNRLVESMAEYGVELRREFLPISNQPPFREWKSENKNAIKRSESFICLPSSPNLSEAELTMVANLFLEKLESIREQ